MGETTRVGIDFGHTIALFNEEQPRNHSFEIIRHIVAKFGPESVFIVSKAGLTNRLKIFAWLDKHRFCEQTGFLQENIRFVLEFEDKLILVENLGIHLFLDDAVKIARLLVGSDSIVKFCWFHGTPNSLQLIPKHHRHKVVLIKNGEWNRMGKVLSKIPTSSS